MIDISSWIHRLGCKAWEAVLRLRTSLAYRGERDPTRILVDHLTQEQNDAAERLSTRPQLASGERCRVLVLIPFRDRWPLTEACLTAVERQRLDGIDVRIVLLDNGSTSPQTAGGIGAAVARSVQGREIRVLRDDESFNFSRLNNAGVRAHVDFRPDFLLFLNNDVEFSTTNDLKNLVDFARGRPDIGAVGCTLLYPDGRVQHLFVAPGVKIVAAHPLKGRYLPQDALWFQRPRPVAAVTGAVMLVQAEAFARVQGFNQALPQVGQDVDLCLKFRELELTCWVLPQVRGVHHEGASRPLAAIDRRQVELMYQLWGDRLTRDAFYSPRFSRWTETPTLTLGEGPYPWSKVLP